MNSLFWVFIFLYTYNVIDVVAERFYRDFIAYIYIDFSWHISVLNIDQWRQILNRIRDDVR